MNKNQEDNIANLVAHIKQSDAAIAAAEHTLQKLECRSGQDTIAVAIGGVTFRLSDHSPAHSFQAMPVKEHNELRQACINAQKTHLFRLRSKAEGLRWQLREEVKKV